MQQAMRVMQTVILAAGSGSRLAPTRGDVPKPLMNVAGIEQLHTPLRLTFVENLDYAARNGVSLLAAEQAAAPAFFLQMVDHLFPEPALSLLAAAPFAADEVGRVLVDSAPSPDIDLDDATKVQLQRARVSAIGQGLDTWDAIDAGCFVLTHGVFDALRPVPVEEGRSVSSGMRRLVSARTLGAVDLRRERCHSDDRRTAALLAAGRRLQPADGTGDAGRRAAARHLRQPCPRRDRDVVFDVTQ